MWAVMRPVQAVTKDREATAQCELFLTVPNRNILTYLLGQGRGQGQQKQP